MNRKWTKSLRGCFVLQTCLTTHYGLWKGCSKTLWVADIDPEREVCGPAELPGGDSKKDLTSPVGDCLTRVIADRGVCVCVMEESVCCLDVCWTQGSEFIWLTEPPGGTTELMMHSVMASKANTPKWLPAWLNVTQLLVRPMCLLVLWWGHPFNLSKYHEIHFWYSLCVSRGLAASAWFQLFIQK